MSDSSDRRLVRDLARQYAELAALPRQDERRAFWRAHHSLKPTRPAVIITYGMHNVWCRETFGEHTLTCQDPYLRGWEQWLRMALFHHTIGDDYLLEPWVTVGAVHTDRGGIWGEAWGVASSFQRPGQEGGAWKSRPPIQSWDDVAKLTPPVHGIDEEATARNVARAHDLFGDILKLNVDRGPVLRSFAADISTTLAGLRGLEQIMIDMYESPEELHALLAFMRDGILENQRQAEAAGHFNLACSINQSVPYAKELPDPRASSAPCTRRELWGFFAAQEYTLISPRLHDEFLYQYQLPIMAAYGLTHYGCCEDLTQKIDMLRQAPNLRSIAVAPRADLGRCVEQAGGDYVLSWRPNPTDMVCCGFDEDKIRRIIGEGLRAAAGSHLNIHLKDIETVEGDPSRLARWTQIVRECIEETAGVYA
ncbi:MAG: hypothetical protein HYU66_15500 [Armatimonadetes bacterium]|nr:hypothetical protein [Armatimonadota bacterium]